MRPIRGWFKARKPLQASRKKYYEDIYGEKNPEEGLEGVHIIDTESESDQDFSSCRRRRQGRKKSSITPHKKNRGRADRDKEIETAGDNEIVVLKLDRTAAVLIDDDSDVDGLFVADLRNHVQSPLDSSTENEVGLSEAKDQHGTNPAFLAEVKKYAVQPPPINNKSSDDLLGKINKRAESFANQSSLAPKKRFEPESDATTVLPSIEEPSHRPLVEVLDDALSSGAFDGETVKNTSRPSIAAVRKHSWDPSQGSDYVYSDVEAEDDVRDTNHQEQNLRSDMHQDEGLHDNDRESQMDNITMGETEDEDSYDGERSVSGLKGETSDGTAKIVSTHRDSSVDFEDDDEVQEVVDLTSPARASSEESAIRSRLLRPSRLDFGDHHSTTSSEPVEALSRTRKRRFGVFASNPRPSIEPDLGDLSDDTRPRRLHDLVRQRRREKEERAVATKRARYNLRPHQQQKGFHQTSLVGYTAGKWSSETDSETEEMQTSRRVTRSMTAKQESVKKPIARFKAARKTAWAAMGLAPKDDIHRSRSYRPVVEVVIPKVVDRSTWSSTSTSQIERKQPPAMDENLVTQDSKRKLALALSGRGVKRMTEHNENDEEEATNNRSSVSRNGRQVLELVLID